MADETIGISGSYLGEYYMTLSLGPYSRPKPFAKSDFQINTVIHLPLPSEMRDDTAVNYTNQDLNTVGDAFNGSDGIGASIGLRNIGSAGSTLLGAGAGAVAGSIFGSGFGDTASRATEELFPPDQVMYATQQYFGVAPNPNPSVMFTGPHLREFSFSWTLYAKTPEESVNIRRLISTLKKRALPENVISGSASILSYPYICQVNFYPWDSPNPNAITSNWGWTDRSIIKMKKCVIAAVNANYNPSNTPAFFEGTKEPVATQLTINLKEIEYMLSNDYGGGDGITASEALLNLGTAAGTLLTNVFSPSTATPTSISDPPSPENTTT